jgi:predicted enzyme related to lactoylglutathione lyase
MTVTGPDFLALQVRDLDRSVAFYETRLGLRPPPTSPPGEVVFDTKPLPFAVREPLPGTDLEAATPRPGVGVSVWLHADDVQDLHDQLVAAGVPISAAPADGPFGRTFTFVDPGGYALTVHSRA